MRRNLNFFWYILKNAVKDKGFAFWTMMYPLMLITFFHFGFSGVMHEEFEKAQIGIHANHPYIFAFDNIDLLEYERMDEDKGIEMLKNESIVAYVKADGSMLVSHSDPAQTAVKEVLDSMKQFEMLARSGASMDSMDFNAVYTKSINQSGGGWKMTFYSIVAMISVYSIFTGLQVSKQDEFSSRIAVSPCSKLTRVLSYLCIGLLVNMVVNVILVMYIQYVLRLNLFPNQGTSFAIIACGNVFGVALGILFGIPKAIKEDAKMSISIAVLLVLTTFAGMMGREIPRMLGEISPWLPKLNPIANLTNLLMRVNLLESTGGYGQGMLLLLLQAFVMLAIGFALLWRRKYERD